jgi:hypothetical protein
LTYDIASQIWDDLGVSKAKNNAIVAALGVLTWGWETSWSFDLKPKNNQNDNGTVDYGPLQVNSARWNEVPAALQEAVFGTDLAAGHRFSGDPDANIQFGLNVLNYLANKYGAELAIQKYNTGESAKFGNPDRAASWQIYGWPLTGLFHITECFPQHW